MSKFKAAKEAGKLFEYFFDRLLKGFRKDQGREPNNLEMILIRQEAGGKAKDANKVIEVQFGKPFGEEVDELIKSGDVKIGEVTKKNDNVLTREMFENSNLNKSTIEGQMEKITDASNRLDEIMKEQADMYRPKTDAEIKAKFDKQNKESIERLKKKKEDDPGFYTGGITDVEPSLDDIGHGSDSLMARTRLVSPGSQATTSTGLNYLLAEDNDNIRVPFSKGKIAKEVLNKGRRGFMKAAGATGAGIAALKTGLLGFGEKAAPVVEKVAEKAAETAGQAPAYFFKLVEKIKNLGTDVPALGDRQKVTKYKDFELTEDVVTGQQEIQRMKVLDDDSASYYGNPLTEETYMSYKPGKGQIDETTKGKTPPDEYEEGTALLRSDREYAGEIVDESFKISDDILEEVGETVTKKAEGGRIGFSKGKLAKKIIEFFGGLKKSKKLNDDEYQEFLDEVGGADQLEAYNFDGTVGDAQRIVKEQKEYMDDMFMEYKKGNLDPVAGDKSPARKKFLQNKLDEMEMSGDKRLMTTDEIEELSSFDLGSEMDVAKSLAPKMVERLQLKQKYPGITDDLLDKILIDDNVQRKAEVIATMDEALKMMEKGKGSDEIIETFKNVTRTKQAAGGIARMLGE